MPKHKQKQKHHYRHHHQHHSKGGSARLAERAAHRLARMATLRRLLEDPHNPQRASHEAELDACEKAQRIFDANALRRANRADHLRRLLSDPEDPKRRQHASELERIRNFERRLARPAENAEARLRNIAVLRRLADDPFNPRRWKHTDELRRAEAAQARYEAQSGRFETEQPRSWYDAPTERVSDPSNGIPIRLGGGGVVLAQHVQGTSMWQASAPVQLRTGVGQRCLWVNVTIVDNPTGGAPPIPANLLPCQPAMQPSPGEGYVHRREIEPHDLTMADADPSPGPDNEPSSLSLYSPVPGRKVAPLPRSGHSLARGSQWLSEDHDAARFNGSEAATSAILRDDAGSSHDPWYGKRKRSASPRPEEYDDSGVTKKHRGSDYYRPYRPVPRRGQARR